MNNIEPILAELRRVLDRIRFAEIVREEARRTVLVPGPASAVKLDAWLIAHGLDDVITVKMSPWLLADTWIVIDEQAIEAGTREAIEEMSRKPLFPTCGACGAVNYGTRPMYHLPSCPISLHLWAMVTMSPRSAFRITGT